MGAVERGATHGALPGGGGRAGHVPEERAGGRSPVHLLGVLVWQGTHHTAWRQTNVYQGYLLASEAERAIRAVLSARGSNLPVEVFQAQITAVVPIGTDRLNADQFSRLFTALVSP